MTADQRRRFVRISAAGITFQGGSAAVDSSTIMAALVHQLTGSAIAVGAVTAILRVGWLTPQLVVGYFAERRGASLRYYAIGGFGRAACLAALAVLLAAGGALPAGTMSAGVLLLWTAYAFVSGIVAAPYNDLVARSVPSGRRSRLLATRFFGGGLVALAVVAFADRVVGAMPFPASYAAIVAAASLLMFVSAGLFVSMGEPAAAPARPPPVLGFAAYLRDGREVFRQDRRFRQFVLAQWCGAVVLAAMPFYVVQAADSGVAFAGVALLLGAQTAGALVSNLLWGWWGDRLGKGSLLRAIAAGRALPAAAVLAAIVAGGPLPALPFFLAVFFVLGALANGLTIAVIGYLMEISPEDRRPSYSGYFNALTAPAFLFPLLGGGLAAAAGYAAVFAVSLAAALAQTALLLRLSRSSSRR